MLRFCLAAALASTSALAQVEEPQPPRKAPAPRTEIIFGTGSTIGGERDEPMVDVIESTYRPRFSGLIKVRANFNDKLLASVNEL